mmetsp:Transcript_10695/g.11759  ORF Transcript_10695/g.11759 Transcript_10695/m.11759 type:complete len:272 (-) Transcript_10695:68-883(-)
MTDITITIKALSGSSYKVTLELSKQPEMLWEYAKRLILVKNPSYSGNTIETVNVSSLDRCVFKRQLLCPLARVSELGFVPGEKNEVFIVFALGAGLAPPTTLLTRVKYETRASGDKIHTHSERFKFEQKCPTTRHDKRSEDVCKHCGRLPYCKAVLQHHEIPDCPYESHLEISLQFKRFSYPGGDDFFTILLDKIVSGTDFIVKNEHGEIVPGCIESRKGKWTKQKRPTIVWVSDNILAGMYSVVFNDSSLKHTGNMPETIGSTQWTFSVK